jgi:hypothetical protein
MRIYYIIRDQSAVKQTNNQREALMAEWQAQPFGNTVTRRRTGPNEQLTLVKRDVTGEYWLGGVDLDDREVRQRLSSEAARIDGRFTQLQRQFELVALAELRAALPAEDAARGDQLSVQAVAWGERDEAIADVHTYLRSNAAIWYGE